LKRDLQRYEEYVDKQSVNGAKGGRPKKPNESQITQPFFEKAKKADSVSVSDSVNVNDNVNKRKRKVFIKPTIEDIKKEFPTFNPESFLNYYESNGWMVGKNKMANWNAAVKNWMAKDYNQQTQITPNKPKFGTLEDE
jgi:chitodextrinase